MGGLRKLEKPGTSLPGASGGTQLPGTWLLALRDRVGLLTSRMEDRDVVRLHHQAGGDLSQQQ